jgi:hypothetical protein
MIEQLEKGKSHLANTCRTLTRGTLHDFIDFVLANQQPIVAVWAKGKNGERHLIDYVVGDPDEIVASYHYSVFLEIINPIVSPGYDDQHPLEVNNYMLAPGGDGPQASTWKDKPHRLIYDLCAEITRLREKA